MTSFYPGKGLSPSSPPDPAGIDLSQSVCPPGPPLMEILCLKEAGRPSSRFSYSWSSLDIHLTCRREYRLDNEVERFEVGNTASVAGTKHVTMISIDYLQTRR